MSAAVASNFAAGTVAAPAIYLSTDTGTGLYRIGANNDGFAINGTKLLDFGSALLGVTGALTVSTTLGVTGASTIAALSATSGTFSTTLGVTGATTLSSTLAAGATTITGTLSTTSYVGIGTTTPTTFGAFAVRLGVSNYYGRTVSGAFSDAANSTLEIGHAANVVFLDTESSGVALKVQQNGTVITTTSSTGLAVTGVLSATGVVTFSNYGAGTATFSGAGVISSVSDETWKIKDGIPTDPDAMLKKLEPGYWYYNDEKKETFGTDRQLGFYAQNVNAAIGPEAAPIPESVTIKNEDGTETTTTKPWGYYDRSVLAVTVMSLQKALATIETLAAKVAKLEAA